MNSRVKMPDAPKLYLWDETILKGVPMDFRQNSYLERPSLCHETEINEPGSTASAHRSSMAFLKSTATTVTSLTTGMNKSPIPIS